MDRDGTIIKEKGYISKPEDVELLPKAISGIKLLKAKKFKLIVLTNQSGVGRGYFSLKDLKRVNERFFKLLKQKGTSVDKLYFCPHKPENNCGCRKPETGMLEQARLDFDINLETSYMIGDKIEDIGLGKRANLKTILVLTGYGKGTRKEVTPDFVAKNLLEAAKWICLKV